MEETTAEVQEQRAEQTPAPSEAAPRESQPQQAQAPAPEQREVREQRPQQDPRLRRRRRKVCEFCKEKVEYIDYKDVARLRRFLSERAKILPRRITGTCAKHQRVLTEAVKRSRQIALIPYISD